jgi:Heterokaryon incompatibility protein (HET)
MSSPELQKPPRSLTMEHRWTRLATDNTSAANKPYFTYAQLGGTNHIRLITLEPDIHEELLRFRLDDVLLDQARSYTAISYTWGDRTVLTPVECNGWRVDITPNLCGALRFLRHPVEEVVVWADALCINQEDIDERGKQVRLMGSIYANAAQVMVWLGEEDGDTKLAFEALRNLAASHRQSLNESSGYGTIIDVDNAQLGAIKRILERPWFSRTWTLQEVVLAKDALFVCGNEQISFSTFDEACQCTHYHNLDVAIGYLHITLLDMSSTHQNLRSDDTTTATEALSLINLLSQTRFNESTDPRDKIYGLLGIATKYGSIGPDYALTMAEVYLDTVRVLIDVHDHLGVLSNCQYVKRSPDIPSWAPDWSKAPEQNLLEWRATDGRPFFTTAAHTKPVVIPSADKKELILKGIKIDVIRKLRSTRHGFENTHNDSFLPTLELCQRLAEDVGLVGSYPYTNQSYARAYRDTLYADLSPYSDRADDDFNYNWYPSYMEAIERGEKLARDTDPDINVLKEMAKMITWATRGRSLLVSESGYIGLGPEATCVGDVICILLGGSMPYILRTKDDRYELVGECFVHGLMDGQGLELKDLEKDCKMFCLV